MPPASLAEEHPGLRSRWWFLGHDFWGTRPRVVRNFRRPVAGSLFVFFFEFWEVQLGYGHELRWDSSISSWWFGTFSMFPYIGNVIIPIDFHIFQRGSNHQPGMIHLMFICICWVGNWLNWLPASSVVSRPPGNTCEAHGLPYEQKSICLHRPTKYHIKTIKMIVSRSIKLMGQNSDFDVYLEGLGA